MDSLRITGGSSSSYAPLKSFNSSNQMNDSVIHPDQSQQQLSMDKLGDVIEGANHFFRSANTHVQFHLHEELNTYYVEIRNSLNNEVIKEIPPKKFLDMMAKLQELAGVLIDERI